MAGGADVCLVLISIFIPPLGVLLKRGCGADFLINILLTLLCHIPGVIHAIYVILHDRERRQDRRAYPTHTQHQTNSQAMYGRGPGYDNKSQYGQKQEQYYDQPQPNHGYVQPVYRDQPAHDIQPMPPTYGDYTEQDIAGHRTGPARGGKHEYIRQASDAPPMNQGYGTKEI